MKKGVPSRPRPPPPLASRSATASSSCRSVSAGSAAATSSAAKAAKIKKDPAKKGSRLGRRVVLHRGRDDPQVRTIVKVLHLNGKAKAAKPCRRKSCSAQPNPDSWGDYETKIEKNGKVVSKPIGDVCGGCVLTYSKGGFEISGELEEVLDKCGVDEDLNNSFILADRRRRGVDRVHHVQAQVTKRHSEGLDMAIPMVGLTPQEFFEWKGFSHEDVGRKLKDLPHPAHNNSFKGIIVPDDGTLGSKGVTYKYWRRVESSLEHFVLPKDEHVLEDQAWDVYDEITQPLKDEDSEVAW
jgi:hypothetical protein